VGLIQALESQGEEMGRLLEKKREAENNFKKK
jgi:hypothetical protein